MEMFLECVRYGSTNKDACMVARISETTLYRWIEKGKHAKRGPHRKFCDSLETALAHFQYVHLQAIERCSLEETQSTREVIEYEGGEVVTLPDGKRQLRPGKVKSVRREIRTHPPTLQGSMWLLERRFPDKWGPPRKELPAAGANGKRLLIVCTIKRKNDTISPKIAPNCTLRTCFALFLVGFSLEPEAPVAPTRACRLR